MPARDRAFARTAADNPTAARDATCIDFDAHRRSGGGRRLYRWNRGT